MNRLARVLLWLFLASTLTAQSKNLLFYGNSFTYYVWGYGVPELVQRIAVEAGHPSPTIVTALTGGGTLPFYATDPTQVARISNSLPPGQTWDHVVMQGHALEATNGVGFNAAQFLSGAVAIMTNVRNHSPAARAVMFQTWASAWGQMYYNYPSPWTVPMALHNEIRGNYRLAVNNINAGFGAGAATNAAAGDGVALLEWNPAWYEPDLFHPNPSMILVAAMTIYTSIYGQTVCGIGPWNPAGQLALALAPYGIDEADWNHLAGIADRCADPTLRRFPGSGDHLLLEARTGTSPLTACPVRQMTTGTFVEVQMRSMNGVFHGAAGWLLVDTFPTGSPPGPSVVYPEIRVVGALSILNTSASLASPLSFSIQMPFSWPGTSVLVQGLAWQASTETANWFTTTDAHEFVFF